MRLMTRKGLRAMVPVVGVPREIKAAAKTTEDLAARKVELVKATTEAEVDHVLTENYLKQAADMAISANPFVNEFMAAVFTLVADSTTPIAVDQDFFHKQSAGAAGSGVAAIINSLRKDNEPDVPFIMQTIGIGICYYGPVQELSWLQALALEFWQNDLKVFELLVANCLTSLIILDNAASTPAAPIINIDTLAGGGYEIEGGGFPVLKTNIDTKLIIKQLGGGVLPDPGTALSGSISLYLNLDGEPLD